jgi:hypothetical protein
MSMIANHSDQSASKDYVYVLSNEVFNVCKDGEYRPLYKVGETYDIRQRVASLSSTTAVPVEFRVEKALHVYNGRAREVEQAIHRRLSEYRYSDQREFFFCELDVISEALQIFVDSGESEWYDVPEPPPAPRYPTRTSTERHDFRDFSWKCYEKGVISSYKTRKRSNVETYLTPSNISKVFGSLSENKGEFDRISNVPFEEHQQADKDRFVEIVDDAIRIVNETLPVNQRGYPKATLKMFREAFTC